MPIYEFYCDSCHTIFNFLSRKVNTSARPACPRCKRKLKREVSLFAAGGSAADDGDMDDLPVDESRMERALTELAGEAEKINEDDPRQAAGLMRKFSRMTGLEFGENVETALSRMEAGEDPEKIEQEMGDLMDDEEPFVLPGRKGGKGRAGKRGPARRDSTLYEM